MEEKNVDREMVEEKGRQIGEVIDGCSLQEVFYILGFVLVEVVMNARDQGFDVKEVVADWLKTLIQSIMSIDFSKQVDIDDRGN